MMTAAQTASRAQPCEPIERRAMGRQLNDDEVKLIVEVFAEMAEPNATLAVALLKERGLEISIPTACKYALANGIDLGGQGRRHGATNLQPGEKWSKLRGQVLELHSKGKTVAEIVRKLGCSRAIAHRYISEAEAKKD